MTMKKFTGNLTRDSNSHHHHHHHLRSSTKRRIVAQIMTEYCSNNIQCVNGILSNVNKTTRQPFGKENLHKPGAATAEIHKNRLAILGKKTFLVKRDNTVDLSAIKALWPCLVWCSKMKTSRSGYVWVNRNILWHYPKQRTMAQRKCLIIHGRR